jgi:hypothetical protein
MRVPAIVVVLGLGLCGQLARAQNPSAGRSISSRFADAATRALRVIEIDTSVPVRGDDVESGGPASSLILDAADEAGSSPENGAVQLLRLMYVQKRADNLHAHATAVPASAEPARTQRACFSAVEALFEAKRFDAIPGMCETWIGPAVLVAKRLVDAAPTSSSRAESSADASNTNHPLTIQRGSSTAAPSARQSSNLGPPVEIPRQEPLKEQASETPSAANSRSDRSQQRSVRSKKGSEATSESRPSIPFPGYRRPPRTLADYLRNGRIIVAVLLGGIAVLALIRLLSALSKPPLRGRLVIERAGINLADIDFHDFATEEFEVRETEHKTTVSRTDIAVGTGSNIRLVALTMRKIDKKWQPFVTPIDCTLLFDGRRITETEPLPSSDPLLVAGRHIKLIYYH